MNDYWWQMANGGWLMIDDWWDNTWLLTDVADDCWILSDDDEIESDDNSLNSTALGHDQPLWLPLVFIWIGFICSFYFRFNFSW